MLQILKMVTRRRRKPTESSFSWSSPGSEPVWVLQSYAALFMLLLSAVWRRGSQVTQVCLSWYLSRCTWQLVSRTNWRRSCEDSSRVPRLVLEGQRTLSCRSWRTWWRWPLPESRAPRARWVHRRAHQLSHNYKKLFFMFYRHQQFSYQIPQSRGNCWFFESWENYEEIIIKGRSVTKILLTICEETISWLPNLTRTIWDPQFTGSTLHTRKWSPSFWERSDVIYPICFPSYHHLHMLTGC